MGCHQAHHLKGVGACRRAGTRTGAEGIGVRTVGRLHTERSGLGQTIDRTLGREQTGAQLAIGRSLCLRLGDPRLEQLQRP